MKTLAKNKIIIELLKLLLLSMSITAIYFLLTYLAVLFISTDYVDFCKKIVAILCFGVFAIGYASYMNNVKKIKSKK